MSNLNRFVVALAKADAVSVDGGPLLTDWDVQEPSDKQDILVRFSWEDQDYEYCSEVSEELLEKGIFDTDGTFSVDTEEGPLLIKFYRVSQIQA